MQREYFISLEIEGGARTLFWNGLNDWSIEFPNAWLYATKAEANAMALVVTVAYNVKPTVEYKER